MWSIVPEGGVPSAFFTYLGVPLDRYPNQLRKLPPFQGASGKQLQLAACHLPWPLGPACCVGGGPSHSGPLSPLQAGRELLHSHPYAQEDIQDRLQSLTHKWEELNHKMVEREDRLRQTREQGQFLELLQVPGECGVGPRTPEGRSGLGWGRMGTGRKERAGKSGPIKLYKEFWPTGQSMATTTVASVCLMCYLNSNPLEKKIRKWFVHYSLEGHDGSLVRLGPGTP